MMTSVDGVVDTTINDGNLLVLVHVTTSQQEETHQQRSHGYAYRQLQ